MSHPRSAAVIALRPVTDADSPFLLEVYASTRAAQLAPLGWDEATVRKFLARQHAIQQLGWSASSPGAAYDVVVVDGTDAGRITVDNRAEEVRLVDIALLPTHTGRGIGTRLLTIVLEQASRREVPVTLHVECHNRARRLYERLGFTEVAHDGIYVLMRVPPRLTVATKYRRKVPATRKSGVAANSERDRT